MECFYTGAKTDTTVKTHWGTRPKWSPHGSALQRQKDLFLSSRGSCDIRDVWESVSVLCFCYCFHFQVRVSVSYGNWDLSIEHTWWNVVCHLWEEIKILKLDANAKLPRPCVLSVCAPHRLEVRNQTLQQAHILRLSPSCLNVTIKNKQKNILFAEEI